MGIVWGILAGLALRLLLVWGGWCDGNVVADDAYYYFGIARNLAMGAGPTFDGLAWTNGFHPLYELLLVPVFFAGRLLGWDAWAKVHAALTLCSVCDAITAWLLALVLRQLGYPRGGSIAAWLWSLSPVSLLLTLRGIESSVSALATAAVLLVLIRRGARFWSARAGVSFGLVLGIAFLARTDNGPLLGAASLVFLFVAMRDNTPEGTARRGVIRGLAGAAAGGAMVSLPWLAWNLHVFGTPFQVSGLAKFHNRSIHGALDALRDDNRFVEIIRRVAAPMLELGQYLAGEDQSARHLTLWVWWLMSFALVFAAPFVRRAWREPRGPLDRAVLAFAATFVVLHIALYGFVVGTYAMWYATVPLLIATLIAGGIAAERLMETLTSAQRRQWCAGVSFLALGVYSNFFARVPHGREAQWRAIGPVFELIHERFPQVRVVGGFNVGAFGYFAPERYGIRIVNLDGLVNNALYDAWRRGAALRYFEEHLDLIVLDAPETMQAWLRPGEWEQLTREFPRQGSSLIYGPREWSRGGTQSGASGTAPPANHASVNVVPRPR